MATSVPSLAVPRTILSWAKSTPPRAQPMGGMMMLLTSELTTAPSETPMMTPMARANALDLVRNSRKPLMADLDSVLDHLRETLGLGDPALDLCLARDAADDTRTGGDHFL